MGWVKAEITGFQYWVPVCYAYASNPIWSEDWSFQDSQALEALTSGKCCICCNFRMNKVLLKYLMPHLNPVEDVSEGKIKLQLLHMGFEFGLGENLSISRRGKYLQISFVNFWCTKSNFLNCWKDTAIFMTIISSLRGTLLVLEMLVPHHECA